ncbi:MAG: LL-diaminopimelate aminotransferase [Cyanobacteria bacterium P01_F01_bin.33]
MIRFARRLQPLQGNVFADMDRAKAEARAAGIEVIDLSLGSSDLPPPPEAIAVLHEAADDPSTYGYCLFDSTRDFRQACAQWYETKFGISVDPETEVLTLIGSQEGTAHLPLALLNPGDVALLCDPGYPSHAGGVYLADGEIYGMPLRAEHHFLPVFDEIPADICDRARLMVLSYPHNPTTAVASHEFWQKALDFCTAHNIVLAHDFPYVDWVFEGDPAASVLQIDLERAHTIEFFTMSKSFHMGGFRVGYAIGNADIIRALRQVKAVVDFNQYRGILRAAAHLLTHPTDFIEQSLQVYRERRDRCVQALYQIGWDIPSPTASMYLWAALPSTYAGDAKQFCLDLVRQTGVALSPGSGFGPSGEGYVRFALVEECEVLERAVVRIGTFLGSQP